MTKKLTVQNLFILLLFFGIFIFSLQPITDPDFWWHLKTGQLIAETSLIPHFDAYSSTANGNPWIAHEWLSELIFFLLYRMGGQVLLICLFAAILTALFFICYLRCPGESKPYIAGFALILGALMSCSTWGVRPQVFSFLLTSIFLFLLDRYKNTGKIGNLIALPLLELLWVNLHGAFILGFVLIAVYFGADLIDATIDAVKGKSPLKLPRSAIWFSGTLIASILISLINPNGLKILIYPFQTWNDPSISQYILEWASPNFHLLSALPLLGMILALMGFAMISPRRISTVNLLLCLGFGFATLHAMKQVTYFALVSIPVLAELAASVIPARKSETVASPKLFRLVSIIVLIGLFAATVAGISRLKGKQEKAESLYFPQAAVDWVAANRPQGNVFNAYQYGGYLIWRLYPEYKVYIDGRCDMYGSDFLAEYVSIRSISSGWQESMDEYHIGWILVEKESLLARALQLTTNWKEAYQDDMSVIYVRE